MIPKIIHYCWFGRSPMPKLAQKCIESWKKYCPDYEIREWNEDTFDISSNLYTQQAYAAKKFAFVTDYVRLKALYEIGGIYMDTDVELLGCLDDYLSLECFSGFESKTRIPTGLMASKPGTPIMRELLSYYDSRPFLKLDGSPDLQTNVETITATFEKYGLVKNGKKQTIQGFTLFPAEYFCPKNYDTGKLHITNNTRAIHHFDGSWLPEENKLWAKKHRKLSRFFGAKLAEYILVLQKKYQELGFSCLIRKVFSRLFSRS